MIPKPPRPYEDMTDTEIIDWLISRGADGVLASLILASVRGRPYSDIEIIETDTHGNQRIITPDGEILKDDGFDETLV